MGALTGCTSSASGPCGYAGYGSCNVQATAQMSRFDDVRGCYAAAAPVVGLCGSSVLDIRNAQCGHSASIAPDCAISPDGSIYVTDEDNDEYVSGAGWRSMHYVSYNGTGRPVSANLTADDMQRCAVALCAPSCDGRSEPVASVLPGLCVDAGAPDGRDTASGE